MPSKLALINQIHAVLQQQHGGEAIFPFSPQRMISPQRILIKVLKWHCNEKIFDPILNTTEQRFHTSLNGVFISSIKILKVF